jgi:hypothetical protein
VSGVRPDFGRGGRQPDTSERKSMDRRARELARGVLGVAA